MTAVFEFLFKYRPLLYEKGTLDFQPLWPSYVNWLLLIAAIAIPWLLYRRSKGAVPNSWRYSLSALRTSALLVILLILLQPVLLLHSVVPQQNFVAVAYDFSKSMEIQDAEDDLSRLQLEERILRSGNSPAFESLASKFRLRYFRFSDSAERTEAFSGEARHGEITDLENSLNQILDELTSVPLAGIVLMTDGADNRSGNLDGLISRLRAHGVAVYSIGIGTERFSKDVEIMSVTAPRTVLKDTVVEAEVAVRSTGYPGQRAKLLVTEQGSPLESREIVLGSDGEVKTYKVNLSGQLDGPRNFHFLVEPLPGEIVEKNNGKTILVRVEDEQPKILYVEGEPRWEYGFLRRATEEDKNLLVTTLLRQADGKFLRQGIESSSTLEEGFPVDKEELFQYEAIILGSIEAGFFTFDQLRMISDFVSQRGGGFLMLGGRSSFSQGGYIDTPLEDLLPLYLAPETDTSQGFQSLEFKVRLTDYGAEHPICRLSLSESLNRKRWENAPNLIGFNSTAGPKPGATVLARGTVYTDDDRIDNGRNPVILAFQRFGKGKSVAFTPVSSWHWKMGQDREDDFHKLFWRQMLRWLVSDVPDSVTIATEEHSYSLDDVAVLKAEAGNAAFLPLNNVRFTGQVKAPSGQVTEVPLIWDSEKEGRYSGMFRPREEGIHEIVGEAFQGNEYLGSARTSFLVEESTKEFHQAALNSSLLRRLSSETGGRYYSADDIRSLSEDISYTEKGISQMEEKDLWDMPFLFLLLIGLVSTEWILRKRKGLS